MDEDAVKIGSLEELLLVKMGLEISH